MKQMKKRWCRWARVTAILAVSLLLLSDADHWGLLLAGLVSALVCEWIARHRLHCPACGTGVNFWKSYEENRFCSACGTQFTWIDTWQEKENS